MFTTIFIQPLFNVLILIYNLLPWHDIGIATIILTVLLRMILYPIYQKGAVSQAKLAKLQPKVKEVRDKHKKDFEKQAQELRRLYKDHKINPFGGFLFLLIQLPIIFALFRLFLGGFGGERLSSLLYGFVENPGAVNTLFLNSIDLFERSFLLVALTAIVQYLQGYLMTKIQPATGQKQNQFVSLLTKQMLYIGPLFTILILGSLPSVIAVYWLTTTVISVIQQYFINKTVRQEMS